MNLFKKKMYFYALTTKDAPNLFLTITSNIKECGEYADKLLKEAYLNNFKCWANLGGFNVDDLNAWILFRMSSIPKEELDYYTITKISYTPKDLSAILRMFAGCVPLKCSYEFPYESSYFEKRLDAVTENE